MLQSSFRRSATSRPPPTKADPDCRHRFNVARAEEPKIRRTLKFTRNELWKFAQGRREEGSCQEAVSRAGKDIKKARTQEIHLATSASCLSSFCSRAGYSRSPIVRLLSQPCGRRKSTAPKRTEAKAQRQFNKRALEVENIVLRQYHAVGIRTYQKRFIPR